MGTSSTAAAGRVRTIEDARAFVERAGMCTIFDDRTGRLPGLWEAVDAPDKQPGERGWGEKMGKVWSWKNELPARYPDALFYGKLRNGRAVLCTMERLSELYREQHRSIETVSETARELYEVIRQGPIANKELRLATGLAGKGGKSRFDRALLELQTALLIVRSNAPGVEHDTWVTFEAQYPRQAAEVS